MIFSVDPGCRGCGAALWAEGKLLSAEYIPNPMLKGLGVDSARHMAEALCCWVAPLVEGDSVVLEVPRVYPARFQKGDQNDLIALSLVVGAIAGAFESDLTFVQCFPRDWKGTADADRVVIPMIQGLLKSHETSAVRLPRSAELQHNVWDAVGIGLHYLKRLGPTRVFSKG